MFFTGLGTATPPQRYTQKQCWDALQQSPQFVQLDQRAQGILHRVLLRDNGIQSRSLALDSLDRIFTVDPDKLHRHFAVNAPALAQRTYRFIACEPRRSTFALVASHLLGVIGCNDVTRHDAVVSVHAGFERRELSALWPSGRGWNLHEGARGLFSHCFVASSPRYADERAAADEL